MPRVLLLVPLALFGLSGCRNACQQVCAEMKRYAESDECGMEVDDEEFEACLDAYPASSLTPELRDQCNEFSDPETLREWWSCDDLAENFQNGVP